MKKKILAVFMVACSFGAYSQALQRIYLLPGQGSDARIFSKLSFDSARYEVIHIQYPVPERKESMTSYASKLVSQVDTNFPVVLIGVSLGGMLAIEIAKQVTIEKVIIISSAKSRKELPIGYRTQRYLPIYKIIPAALIKAGARVVQPLFEPDRAKEKETFVAMLKDKDKYFMKRGIGMIVRWEPNQLPDGIVHIHGDNDHTLPFRKISAPIKVEGGGHMMALTKPEVVQSILNAQIN